MEVYAQFEGNIPLQYESVSTSYLNKIDGSEPAIMRMRPTYGNKSLDNNKHMSKNLTSRKNSGNFQVPIYWNRILPFLEPIMIRMQSYRTVTKRWTAIVVT